MRAVLAQVKPGEELALVAYKEQFLLYLDRPTVNFGHRRWLEGPQESTTRRRGSMRRLIACCWCPQTH